MGGEKWKDKHFQGVKQYVTTQVMVWGATSHKGVGCIMWAQRKIDGPEYRKILMRGVAESARMLGWKLGEYIFQQDIATVHTTRANLEYIQRKGIRVLPWPSKSLDMNPIKNLWGWMKGRLNSMLGAKKAEVLWRPIQMCGTTFPLASVRA
jgi:hypothetical protein